MAPKRSSQKAIIPIDGYDSIVSELIDLVESARHVSARSVNAIMTATFWEIGRRIVETEQRGERRAAYGEALLSNLSVDLTAKFGRGFSARNLRQMRQFYLVRPMELIRQTRSAELESKPLEGLSVGDSEIWQTVSAKSS